jgi:hypothetical protein
MIYLVGEEGYLKGPGFFAFTKGMPIMLQQNTNTYAGLVNGMRGTVEEVILDRDVQGTVLALQGRLFYVSDFANCIDSFMDGTWCPVYSMYSPSAMCPSTACT